MADSSLSSPSSKGGKSSISASPVASASSSSSMDNPTLTKRWMREAKERFRMYLQSTWHGCSFAWSLVEKRNLCLLCQTTEDCRHKQAVRTPQQRPQKGVSQSNSMQTSRESHPYRSLCPLHSSARLVAVVVSGGSSIIQELPIPIMYHRSGATLTVLVVLP